MENTYDILLSMHGLVGVAALVTYWAAALARKGSPLHIVSGRIYLLAMLGICATAIPMAAIFLARGRTVPGVFLGYLVLITATAMWGGFRAIRLKRSESSFRAGSYPAVSVANLAAGLLVLALGLANTSPLLSGISFIGISIGVGNLRRLRSPLGVSNWWIMEHYGAMLGCGIATHVAFLSIGLNRLIQAAGMQLPGTVSLLAWALPVTTAAIAAIMLNRKYAGARASRSPTTAVNA
ncbi:MAG: hypothetical protein R3E77_16475 [Steroidobacteraceae bacterium]